MLNQLSTLVVIRLLATRNSRAAGSSPRLTKATAILTGNFEPGTFSRRSRYTLKRLRKTRSTRSSRRTMLMLTRAKMRMLEAMGVGKRSCWMRTWTAVRPTTKTRTETRIMRFQRVRAASSVSGSSVIGVGQGAGFRHAVYRRGLRQATADASSVPRRQAIEAARKDSALQDASPGKYRRWGKGKARQNPAMAGREAGSDGGGLQGAGGGKQRGEPLLHSRGGEAEGFGLRLQPLLDSADECQMELVAGTVSDDRPHQGLAQQVQVSQKVQDLVADEFVRKAEGTVQDAVVTDHQGVFQRATLGQTHALERIQVFQKAVRAARRKIARVAVTADLHGHGLLA